MTSGDQTHDPVAPRVLLTDTCRWPTPARLAVALANQGCEVFALCRFPGHPLLKTRAVRRAFPYEGFRRLQSLAEAIRCSSPDIIVPCDDRGVQHLHDLHAISVAEGESGRAIANLIEHSLGAPDSYPIVSSRYDLLKLASAEGVLVPRTYAVRSLEDLKSCFSGHESSLVLKADGSWGGRGVRFVTNLEQAQQSYRELISSPTRMQALRLFAMSRDRSWLLSRHGDQQPSVVAQAQVSGRPANCAAFCWKGRVLAVIAVEVFSSSGIKGPATVVRVVDSPEMTYAAERIAARLNFTGFFGLDFMIESKTGATYLIEMNPRCTPLCHLQLGQGGDLVGSLWAQLANQSHRPTHAPNNSEVIAYFPQAWASHSEFLDISFHDIPNGQPELVKELLHPWSERSLLGRFVDHLRRLRGQPDPVAYVFRDAVPPHLAPAASDADSGHLTVATAILDTAVPPQAAPTPKA